MIYMMASDGEVNDEEMNYLAVKLYAIGDANELIKLSQKYSLADGDADEEEQNLFFFFVQAFGISEEDIQPYIDILSTKNDLASFVA